MALVNLFLVKINQTQQELCMRFDSASNKTTQKKE